ncbi:MAG: hypothetical protein EOO22_04940 [Comamonadaceae bacterium]|nr:MAG: hypothetical protein EOO22_04940 [Comamonadaceae bacterium]
MNTPDISLRAGEPPIDDDALPRLSDGFEPPISDIAEEEGIDLSDASELDADNVIADEEDRRVIQPS